MMPGDEPRQRRVLTGVLVAATLGVSLSGCERENDEEPRSERQAKQQKTKQEKPSKPEVDDTGMTEGKEQTAESTNEQKPADASDNVDANYVVSAGDVVTCMLGEEGRPTCWGWDLYGQTSPPDIRLRTLSAAKDTVCGISLEDELKCWGNPLGDSGENLPEGGDPVGKYRSVSVAYGHACAIPKGEKQVECWIPSKLLMGDVVGAPDGTYRTIKTTFYGVCGLTYDGKINCLGNAFEDVEPMSGEFVQMDAGPGIVCAIDTEGKVHCFAKEGNDVTNVPDGTYDTVRVGDDYACALDMDGHINCWGASLDRVDGIYSDVPEGQFEALAVGDHHGCAMNADYEVQCWGANDYGQASPPDRYTPGSRR